MDGPDFRTLEEGRVWGQMGWVEVRGTGVREVGLWDLKSGRSREGTLNEVGDDQP